MRTRAYPIGGDSLFPLLFVAFVGLCALITLAIFLDGVDAVLTQGYRASWWWEWTDAGGERQLPGRSGGLGISVGLPTVLLGISQITMMIAVWSIATWSVIWLLSRDRRFLKWLAGIAAIVAVGTAVAAGVLSFAM